MRAGLAAILVSAGFLSACHPVDHSVSPSPTTERSRGVEETDPGVILNPAWVPGQ